MKKADKGLIQKADKGLIQRADKGLIQKADKGLIQRADKGLIQKADKGLIQKAYKGLIQRADKGLIQKADKGLIKKADKVLIQKADKVLIQKADMGLIKIAVEVFCIGLCKYLTYLCLLQGGFTRWNDGTLLTHSLWSESKAVRDINKTTQILTYYRGVKRSNRCHSQLLKRIGHTNNERNRSIKTVLSQRLIHIVNFT